MYNQLGSLGHHIWTQLICNQVVTCSERGQFQIPSRIGNEYLWYLSLIHCNCPPGSSNFVKMISDWVSGKIYFQVFSGNYHEILPREIPKSTKTGQTNCHLMWVPGRLFNIDCLGHGHLIWNQWWVCHTFARFVNFIFAQSESHYQHFGWAILADLENPSSDDFYICIWGLNHVIENGRLEEFLDNQ